MSNFSIKNMTKKQIFLIIGSILIVAGIIFIVWTYSNVVCGLDQYNLTVCSINPTRTAGHLFGGIDPLLYYSYGLFSVVVGLFLIYLGIENKQKKRLEVKAGEA